MNHVAPVLLLFAATAGLGVYNGLGYLRGQRRVGLVAVHLLLGIGALEGLLILLRGTPDGDVTPGGSLVATAAALFAAALFIGLLAPILHRRSKRSAEGALVAHVGAGTLGYLLFLVWVARQ
jgi:Na+-transporting NADH:ubiquinone oxidoreductase subunit NqrD